LGHVCPVAGGSPDKQRRGKGGMEGELIRGGLEEALDGTRAAGPLPVLLVVGGRQGAAASGAVLPR